MSVETSKIKVGLFGGSFNPPHICHTLATLWALQTHGLDEVWWIPTYKHAFDKALLSYEHRRAMCELAIEPLAGVRIVDIEKELEGESRTIETVKALSGRHQNVDFSLIVGADILDETHRWKDWDGLMALVELIVVGRSGFRDADAGRTVELGDISSTSIRHALENCAYESLGSWMPRSVLDYIITHRLYVGPLCP